MLPPLDDELATAVTEFETLAELRSDIEARLREQLEAELELLLRQNTADALVAASSFDSIDPMIERRTAELASGFVRSIERRGIGLEVYLAMTGQTQEQIIERLRGEGELGETRTIGVYSHVDVDTKRRADAAGFDMVVPRSRMAREGAALVERVADLLEELLRDARQCREGAAKGTAAGADAGTPVTGDAPGPASSADPQSGEGPPQDAPPDPSSAAAPGPDEAPTGGDSKS